MATDRTSFFLNARSSVVGYDTLELSHPDFSRTFYLVRNKFPDLVATTEAGASVTFEYAPMRVRLPESLDDLDQALEVDLGDVGEIVAEEQDRITAGSGFLQRPQLVYRGFRSDDLSAPMRGPWTLEVVDLSFTAEGVSFKAQAPGLNDNRTGSLYRVEDFPALRGVL